MMWLKKETKDLGLRDPLPIQFGRFVHQGQERRKRCRGRDRSEKTLQNRASVFDLIKESIPFSVQPAGLGGALALIFSLPLGIAAGLKPDGWVSKLTFAISSIFVSLPNTWLAILLILIVSTELRWLPAIGYKSLSYAWLPPILWDKGTWTHLFGTDQLGRDLLLRSLTGLQNALLIGVVSVIGMFVVGAMIGIVSGYRGGWTDMILMRITDAQMSIPVVILAITILGISRPTPFTVILVLVLAGWPTHARVIRSVTLTESKKEFVRAAQIIGASHSRIMLAHIAPNILPPVAFIAVLDVARMMIFEAIFGFIGIGIQPPTPTFGNILADGTKYLINAWWITVIPGLFLFTALISLNLISNSLEKARNDVLGGCG